MLHCWQQLEWLIQVFESLITWMTFRIDRSHLPHIHIGLYVCTTSHCSLLMRLLSLHLLPQLRSLQVSERATTPPWACWPRNLWVWLLSLPMESLTWTGPQRSWRSRRDASMTSPMSWREFSWSEKNLRITSNGCEYKWVRKSLNIQDGNKVKFHVTIAQVHKTFRCIHFLCSDWIIALISKSDTFIAETTYLKGCA